MKTNNCNKKTDWKKKEPTKPVSPFQQIPNRDIQMRKLFGKVNIKYAWLFDCVCPASIPPIHWLALTQTQRTNKVSRKTIRIKTGFSDLIIKIRFSFALG